MTEHIEKEKLQKDFIEHFCNGSNYVSIFIDDILKFIDDEPTADVAEVRCGRWEEVDWVEPDGHGFGTVRTPKAGLRCNQCSNVFKKELLWKRNYCPNCGAKMAEE